MCSISGKKVLLYDQAVTAMNELMNKKILIVDDEKALLKTVSDALFKEGFFNIYAAASCEEALSVAAEPACRADAAGRKSPGRQRL